MYQIGQEKKRKHPIGKILLITGFFLLFFIIVVKIFNLGEVVYKGPKTVVQLITDSGLKSYNGRVNILFLGTGGAGHEGPDLTDTIIIGSLDKNGKDAVLIPIPRDVWVPSAKGKINSIYALAQEK